MTELNILIFSKVTLKAYSRRKNSRSEESEWISGKLSKFLWDGCIAKSRRIHIRHM